MNTNVYIERLILEGLPISRSQAVLLQLAIETELARLVAEQSLSHLSAGAVPHLSANSIKLTRDAEPAQLAHQIARAIHSTLMPAPTLTRKTRFPGVPHR